MCFLAHPNTSEKVVIRLNQGVFSQELNFKILAPFSSDVPRHFRRLRVDPHLHEKLIADVQTVRGLALRECGPPQAHLSPDGRHVQTTDTDSWHILLQNGDGSLWDVPAIAPYGVASINSEPASQRLRHRIVMAPFYTPASNV